jgi:antitoxin YefM
MSDQSSSQETLYLLQTPANAKRLLAAVERSKAGTVQPMTITELYQRFCLEDDMDDKLELD